MKDEIRKLVDLPLETAAGIALLAARKKMYTKHYMQNVLIDHEYKANNRKVNKKLK